MSPASSRARARAAGPPEPGAELAAASRATIPAVRSPDAGSRTPRPPRMPTSMWCAPSRRVPWAAAAPEMRRSAVSARSAPEIAHPGDERVVVEDHAAAAQPRPPRAQPAGAQGGQREELFARDARFERERELAREVVERELHGVHRAARQPRVAVHGGEAREHARRRRLGTQPLRRRAAAPAGDDRAGAEQRLQGLFGAAARVAAEHRVARPRAPRAGASRGSRPRLRARPEVGVRRSSAPLRISVGIAGSAPGAGGANGLAYGQPAHCGMSLSAIASRALNGANAPAPSALRRRAGFGEPLPRRCRAVPREVLVFAARREVERLVEAFAAAFFGGHGLRAAARAGPCRRAPPSGRPSRTRSASAPRSRPSSSTPSSSCGVALTCRTRPLRARSPESACGGRACAREQPPQVARPGRA